MADQDLIHTAPPGRSYGGGLDARDEFARITAATPRSPLAERAFLTSKLHMARTHPHLSIESRRAIEAQMSEQLAETLTPMVAAVMGPVPGGVGYGAFFTAAYKTAFLTGTSVSWEIIYTNPPGGNVDNWLYLTATNRSAKGVEAFIAYHGQNDTSFNVFDWARGDNDHWQTHIPSARLGQYLGVETIAGGQYTVLPVMNSTFESSPGQWTNQVWLLNIAANQWTLVYQFAYPAALADQTNGWVGSWGPIVETFQDSYAGTGPMGALNTQILTRDGSGNWDQWTPLNPNNSDIRTDNKEFVPAFTIAPNHTWAVHS